MVRSLAKRRVSNHRAGGDPSRRRAKARLLRMRTGFAFSPIARVPACCYCRVMSSRDSASSDITPEVLLRAYACGIFPMAESVDDPSLFWVEPEIRGLIPLDGFRISSRLKRTVRSDTFRAPVNPAFKAVIDGCAPPPPARDDTWINRRIRDLYIGLHEIGHCHSIEAWAGDDLAGGL